MMVELLQQSSASWPYFLNDSRQAPFAYKCCYATKTHVASIDVVQLRPAPMEREAFRLMYCILSPVRLVALLPFTDVVYSALREGPRDGHDMANQSNVSKEKLPQQESLVGSQEKEYSSYVDQINIMSDMVAASVVWLCSTEFTWDGTPKKDECYSSGNGIPCALDGWYSSKDGHPCVFTLQDGISWSSVDAIWANLPGMDLHGRCVRAYAAEMRPRYVSCMTPFIRILAVGAFHLTYRMVTNFAWSD